MNVNVVLTRPDGRNDQLAARALAAGWQPLALPALAIRPLVQPGQCMPKPGDYDLVVFVSRNAARLYLDLLVGQSSGQAWPERTLAATVGRASAQPLYDSSFIRDTQIVHPDSGTPNQDSEALWQCLEPRIPDIRKVLIVRGESGREWLGEQCERMGIDVDRLALYRREPTLWNASQAAELSQALAVPESCVFLLTSSESVDAIHANISRLGLSSAWRRSRFVAIHERIASRLQSVLGATGNVEPPMVKVCSPSDDSIFLAISQMASR